MIDAAENSAWGKLITGEALDGFYRYMRAYETAPDYDEPILTEELRNRLKYDLVSSVGHEFSHEYPINKWITIVSESNADDGLYIVRIKIDDFEKWASTSRINGNFKGDSLGMGGKYYVDLISEIKDAVEHNHSFFECVKEREEYVMTCSCSKRKLDLILN